ncbi:MAG: hypothetical protein COA79_15740 [Planctomycetota bacterium]|nr:MAG: hypothetical protein COA79_15740 [Planctomycetota bacterium]
MHSSTSNSSPLARAPKSRSMATIIIAIFIAIIFVGTSEIFWRQKNHVSFYTDSSARWSKVRDSIYKDNTVVLLGASRMHVGFSHDTFNKTFSNYHLANLATDGSNFIPILENLANDENFKGIILISATINTLTTDNPINSNLIYYQREWNIIRNLELYIDDKFQANLVSLNPNLTFSSILRSLKRSKKIPKKNYLNSQIDREINCDYSLADQNLFKKNNESFKSKTNLIKISNKNIEKINLYIKAIKNRGGKLVFIHFPISFTGQKVINNNIRYSIWKDFENKIDIPTLHYLDYPKLKRFNCPDGSHIDAKDKNKFTKDLIQILIDIKVLP